MALQATLSETEQVKTALIMPALRAQCAGLQGDGA